MMNLTAQVTGGNQVFLRTVFGITVQCMKFLILSGFKTTEAARVVITLPHRSANLTVLVPPQFALIIVRAPQWPAYTKYRLIG
ncbi:hypothetical protein, partial [Burkholderia sp. SIMBA_048]|uniref:hypothetical protein n=1 Tax=Burkholderia sp. SIMBA_048 TaxID=3085789 RepID=UPI0039796F63